MYNAFRMITKTRAATNPTRVVNDLETGKRTENDLSYRSYCLVSNWTGPWYILQPYRQLGGVSTDILYRVSDKVACGV